MRRLLLVEAAPDTLPAGPLDTVVALTAEACYELDRRGVTYTMTTDFGIDRELAAAEPDHWTAEQAWLCRLDDLIREAVPLTRSWKVGPATLYGYTLKVCLDIVFIRAIELARVLEGHQEVVFFKRDAPVVALAPDLLFLKGPSVHSLLLPVFCQARGLAYEEVVVPLGAPQTPEKGPPPSHTAARRPLDMLRGLGARVIGQARRRREAQPLTFLFVGTGYDLSELLTRARARGHRCLMQMVGPEIFDVSAIRTRTVATLPTDPVEASAEWSHLAAAIDTPGHALWEWPDRWQGVPVSEIFRPRFRYWLAEVMPTLTGYVEPFREIYRREAVDYVVAPYLVHVQDLAAIAATKSTGARSVVIDHGDGAFATELYDLINSLQTDIAFGPTRELVDFQAERAVRYDHPTAELHVGSYRWRAYRGLADRSGRGPRPPDGVPTDKPIVVYLQTLLAGDGRYLNMPWFSDAWYYHLSCRLVECFGQSSEYTFVVKLFPGEGHIRNPIDAFVRDTALPNVYLSRTSFKEWLPWADRVIADYPSTGLYEAALAGVPFLALLYDHHRHRPAAVDLLGEWAVPFGDADDAVEAIGRFLATAEFPTTKLQPEGDDILEQLERIRASKPRGAGRPL